MKNITQLTPSATLDFLLDVATVSPVFIFGPPGIGKTSVVEQFAASVGMDCVTFLGSQLAPEDIIGLPKFDGDVSYFCPPRALKRDKPFVLFLDELNACQHDVQRAFYSLINEQRIGELSLPKGSIVIAAGNRAQDSALAKQLPSALINRMIFIEMKACHREWIKWAQANAVHGDVIEFIKLNPSSLSKEPSKIEEPFASPRAWHRLSDAMLAVGAKDGIVTISAAANGLLTPTIARTFTAFNKMHGDRHMVDRIFKGDAKLPSDKADHDLLYFIASAMRDKMYKELPDKSPEFNSAPGKLAKRFTELIVEMSRINIEIAKVCIANRDNEPLPEWFMLSVARSIPSLIKR